MSVYGGYKKNRTLWGIDAVGTVICEVELTSGEIGVGISIGGEAACFIIEQHLARFVEGQGGDSIENCFGKRHLLIASDASSCRCPLQKGTAGNFHDENMLLNRHPGPPQRRAHLGPMLALHHQLRPEGPPDPGSVRARPGPVGRPWETEEGARVRHARGQDQSSASNGAFSLQGLAKRVGWIDKMSP